MAEKNQEKSVLDNVPVDDSDLHGRFESKEHQGKEVLVVVSHCPSCGCPIYGPRTVGAGGQARVQRTCSCGITQTFASTFQQK